jgi:hypothetical protein
MDAEPIRCVWSVPPVPPRLAPGEIHLSLQSLSLDTTSLCGMLATLDHDEKARAFEFHFLEDRSSFTAVRGILRDLLARRSGKCCDKGRLSVSWRVTELTGDKSRRETFRNARANCA